MLLPRKFSLSCFSLLFMIASLHAWAARAPYSDAELRQSESSDESKIRELRNEEITQLRIALGRRAAVNRRADLYLRLAEVDLEGYRITYLLEGRVHERKLASGVKDEFIDHSHSNPYLLAGIKACQEILSFGIPYPKQDQVYYFLGFNYGELGDRRQSLKYYNAIVEKFPESPFVSEAYREMGDDAYQNLNFKRSQTLYELSIRKSTNGETTPRVYHKLAWSYYRTKQFDKAIDAMKTAIASSSKNGEKFLSLREEALRDMAIFMTENGQVDQAIAYFQSVAGDKAFYPRVLETLGKQYERNVEPAKATQVYESLLKTHPDTESAFRVMVKLVDLDLRRGRFKEALTRLTSGKLLVTGDNDTQIAAQNLRAMVRRTATEHHEEYRKKGVKTDLEIAEAYYKTYTNRFLSVDDSRNEIPEIEMYLAEVKRSLGKSRESADLYRKVIDSKDKRYAKEAGALWTASLAEAIKKASSGAKSSEPSDLEKEYVEAADRLQDALGDTSEGREAALKAAEVLAGYPSTKKDSIRRLQKLIATSPKSPQSLTAARLWIQILSEDPAKSDDLKETITSLRANTLLMTADQEIGHSKLKNILGEQDTRQKITTIATAEKNRNFPAAARDYEAFATEATQRDIAEKAYANAVSNYSRATDADSIGRVSNTWLKRFPKSPKAIESIRQSATQLLIDGQFDLAAGFFERLGREENEPDSLSTAALISEGNGSLIKAAELKAVYLQNYAQSPERFRVGLELAILQLANQNESEASKSFQFCLSGPADIASECGARLGDLYLKSADVSSAKAAYKKVASQLPKKKGESLPPYVGYARFKLAEILESETKFEPFALPEEKLKKSLGQRLDFLETLSRAYISAVDAGGPWAVSALDRQAKFVFKFAEELDHIIPPASASPASVAKFRKNIENVSAPLRKKAVATWLDGYNKAVANEVFSAAVPEIADHLADAQSSQVKHAQGARGKFYLSGLPATGEGSSSSLTSTRDKLTKNPRDDRAWVDYGNLLWGSIKPLLSKIAYERALSLNPKNVSALNNRAVVILSGSGEDNWFQAALGASLLHAALAQDEFSLSTKANLASLLTYYRLFAKAEPLWNQVVLKAPAGNSLNESNDGLAVCAQGLGDFNRALMYFKRATEGGQNSSRFALIYNLAARSSCGSEVAELNESSFEGFERLSIENLKRSCSR